MNIEVFAIAWNEQKNLPQFVAWYNFASKITILDNNSTDNTVTHALAMGCEVQSFGGNEQNNLEMLKAKEECWKNSKADWVIVCDIDEFIYHPDLWNILSTTDASIIQCQGYQMISEVNIPFVQVNKGSREPLYDKCICFRPDKIKSINWEPGCHTCKPKGNVKILSDVIKLLHFSLIGREETMERYESYLNRMSKSDKDKGFAYHYNKDIAEEWFNKYLNSAEEVNF